MNANSTATLPTTKIGDLPDFKGVEADTFKSIMRQMAGTVTVIATASEDGLHGMTATAVCSVCADPPTILIIVNRSTRTHPHIENKQAFTINILNESQKDIAELFASKGTDPFAEVSHELMNDGCPVINETTAYLHCSTQAQAIVGTHTIFIGRVIDAGVGTLRPLIYYDGKYCEMASQEPL